MRHKLQDLLQAGAAEMRTVTRSSRHVHGLARDLFEDRDRLRFALNTLALSEQRDEHDLVMREVELAFFRNPERVTRAASRSVLVSAWTELLLAATEKVQSDRHWASIYASGGPSADERLLAERASELPAEWHSV